MVVDVAVAPIVITLMQPLVVASFRPARPDDVDGLGGVLEYPIHSPCIPCCISPFCDGFAEWVVLVDSIENVFEQTGEYPAVDVLFGQS